MMTVGINENLILSKAELFTETNVYLALSFRERSGEALSDFAQLTSGGEVDTGNPMDLAQKLWCPKAPKDTKQNGDTKTKAEKVKEARDGLGEIQNTLVGFLKCYTTTDKIKLNPFKGMEDVISEANYEEKIVEEYVLHKAFINLCTQFIEQVQPFLNKDEFPIRLLLLRQKDKHFLELRRRFIKDNPIVEPMSIPRAQTKLKFTKREIENGQDKMEYLTQSDADQVPLESGEVNDIFNEN